MANRIELVEAQFIGFYHGKWNRTNVVRLIELMNLQEGEWKILKKNCNYLHKSDIKEIDDYFKLRKKDLNV